MDNQTVNVQTPVGNRVLYVKPNLENHQKYTTVVGLPGSFGGFIGESVDVISNPGLELIPDPVDLGI
jgi:hypothetical protein